MPLTPAERRLWFLHRLRPDDPAYTIVTAVDVVGELCVPALIHAVGVLQRRHPVLRSTFELDESRLVRRVRSAGGAGLGGVDLSGLDPDRRDAAADRLLRSVAATALDPTAVPPVRWMLLRLAADRHVLLLVVHHIAFDGGSLDVVGTEIERSYTAALTGTPSLRGAPDDLDLDLGVPRSTADGSRWWAERLAGAPARLHPLGVRTDLPIATEPAVHTVQFVLQAARAAELVALGRRAGCTPFMTLLAVTAAVLSRTSGQLDLVIGIPVAERDDPAAASTVGLLLTMLPVRLDMSGNPTVLELLGRVREATLDAIDHRDVPFERIVEVVAAERSVGHTPVFQVVVAHQRAPRAPHLPGTTTRVLQVDAAAPKYALTVIATEHVEDVEICVQVDRQAGDQHSAQMFAASLDLLLAAAVLDPRRPITHLPMIGRWTPGPEDVTTALGPAVPPAAPSAPRTPLERAIATQWCATLGIDSADVERTFFELGGTSLQLIELHGRLAGDVADLALVDLLRFPTVARLAAHIAGERAEPVISAAAARGERRRAATTGRSRR